MTTPETLDPQPATLTDTIRTEALDLLEEVFAHHHGYILDKGTTLFETLATIDAETASLQYSPHAGNLAAQVNHTRFYLDVVLRGMRDNDYTRADWDSSWKVGTVNEEEWAALVTGLHASYDEVHTFIAGLDSWEETSVGDAMAIIAHSAYHLGEIRQALAVIPLLRPNPA